MTQPHPARVIRQDPAGLRKLTRARILACALVPALSGCDIGMPTDRFDTVPAVTQQRAVAPPGTPEGTCWGQDITPAVIETVTDQAELKPAEVLADGTVLTQATYKTETRQVILRERREIWFETPCPDVLTPEFISALQRALRARGLLSGEPNGEMDARTLRAVRTFQKQQGLDSAILSMTTARQIGLVAVDRIPG